jgi:choline dehydrogenase-like flavoprotein
LRTLRAFAEAMAPGYGSLPSGGEVDVVGPVARYVSGLPPRAAQQVRWALRVFEWLPFPWRFSRASLEARVDFLARLDRSRAGWHQDLLLLLKVLAGLGYGRDRAVTGALGYAMSCEVAGPTPPPAPQRASPLGDLNPPREGEDCDVVIVGSGAGGAVAASVLAEAGLDVVVLESGRYLDRRSYPEDPLEALELLYRDNGLTVARGRPAIPIPLGRAVGGTTVINSGTCFRAPERVLAGWREDFGLEWAGDLDQEYADAEQMLDVRAVDVERMGRNGQLVMEGAEALGLSHGPISRNAGRCFRCSSCPAGCRLDAKRAMHVSYLPRAVAAGARIRAGVDVRRVVLENGRAEGVLGTVRAPPARDGFPPRPFAVRARNVVLAAGAIGTPELLLRSGVESPSAMIGRNLHIHPAAWIGGLFDEEVRGWEGVMQSYYVDEWDELGLLMEATFTPLAFGTQWLPGTGREHAERVLAYDRLASNGVHLSDRSSGRVGLGADGAARIGYRLSREDARKLVFGIARATEIFFAAGATEIYSQVRGAPTIRPGDLAAFEASDPEPDELRLEAFHPMGTARIAADPALGVTGTDGAVYGTAGLYVADASLFPTSIGVNPMMTVIAISARVARGLANRLAG